MGIGCSEESSGAFENMKHWFNYYLKARYLELFLFPGTCSQATGEDEQR